MGPDVIVPVAFFAMVATCCVGVPIARAYARRMDRSAGQPKVPSEVTDRLEHMEQAIDAIAIEVERISEGQRFTTKLLAERGKESAVLPAAGDRDA